MTWLSTATRASALAAVMGLVAGSALAQDQTNISAQNRGFYIGLGLGANFQEDSNVRGGGADATASYDTGFAGVGSLGYAMGNGWRFEVEPGYRRNELDTIGGATAHGHLTLMTLMANAIYDVPFRVPGNLPILRNLLPHVGLGAGVARLIDNSLPYNGLTVSGNTTVPAFQAIGGVEYALTPAVKLGLDYRYLLAHNAAFHVPTSGAAARVGDLNDHAILLTMRYEFGAPRAPAPQPAAAAAPPPVVAAPAAPATPPPPQPKNYAVYFPFNSATLTASAREIVAQAATAARQEQYTRIAVSGYTDTVGTSKYNQRLSEKRAEAVRQELIADGVPSGEIVTRGFGESDLAVPTAGGVKEPRNRRVVIMLQGPAS